MPYDTPVMDYAALKKESRLKQQQTELERKNSFKSSKTPYLRG